jgi:SnoaL-like protein
MTLTLSEVLAIYVQSWSTSDAATRRALLDQCWSNSGTYLDPRNRADGRAALASLIDTFQQRSPGASFRLASGVDAHHDVLRFEWVMLDSTGQVQMEGLDIGELDEDGRIKRITGFFGLLPHPSRD